MKRLIVINIISVLMILIICEIFSRFFGIISLQGYDKNFFIKKNNITLNRPNTNLIVAGKRAKIDNFGFRIPQNDENLNIFENSILIIGDSVSFGFGVKEEESFAGLLRSEIKSNILNSSVIGHNLDSYNFVLKTVTNDSQFQINKVLVFLCLNDVVTSQGVLIKDETKNNEISKKKNNFLNEIIKNDFLIKTNIFLREKSTLFVLLKSISTNPVERHFKYMFSEYDKKNLIENYQKKIKQLKVLSDKKKIKIEFILLPYAYQLINNCEENLMKPQLEIRKVFNKLNIKLNDFTIDFCEKSKNIDLFLTYDPVHLSIVGHKFVNRLIIKKKLIY